MSVPAFLAKVDVRPSPADCWEWQGAIGSDGYGRVKRKGKTWQAHRFSYEHLKGPIPEGLCVLHRCDNPKCVNPTHLFLGTKLDNVADMYRKGRQGWSSPKLTSGQVQEIRQQVESGEAKAAVAERFGVCRSTIQDIANGAWRGADSQDSGQLQLF